MLSTGTGTLIRVLICAQATERLLDGCPNMSSFRKSLTGKAAGLRDPGRGTFIENYTVTGVYKGRSLLLAEFGKLMGVP